MNDWTPTTSEIEDAWCSRWDGEHTGASGEELRGYEAEFDRWLEQVKAEALADAGTLARPLPTRDEIGQAAFDSTDFLDWETCVEIADAVLDLLKGQNND